MAEESKQTASKPDKSKSNRHQAASKRRQPNGIAILVIAMVLAGGAGYGAKYAVDSWSDQAVTERQAVTDDGNLKATPEEDSIINVASQVAPSVVSIMTSTSTQTVFGTNSQRAAGTGIIISSDGYIITNRHVISSSSKIQVIASDGTTYDNIQIVGSDPLNDIAYLKINDVKDLKPAQIGDSSTLRIGQQVVAIGNALGQYQNTVSSGIISGKGRPIVAGNQAGGDAEALTDLIQTDAAINPGNSGGPLLNYSGQVVGINTAVASQAEGIGFAIPINATKGTTKMVLAGKGVQHAYLGVRYTEVTPAVAKQFSLPVKQGAYINGNDSNPAVIKGGPADKAGLKGKDIILKVNDEVVGEKGSVATLIGQYAPGDKIDIQYQRGDKVATTKVTLEAYR